MAKKVYPVHLGGVPTDAGYTFNCMFPMKEMIPASCATDDECENPGKSATCWNGHTSGHRGWPVAANTRILHFEHFDICTPNCTPDWPKMCDEEAECPEVEFDQGGWNNQIALWDYYCKEIHDCLSVGDCFDTHIVPSKEDFEKFYWQVIKCVPGVQVQFKLKCKGLILSPVIDAGDPANGKIDCFDIPDDCRFADPCDGFDVVQMEIISLPEKPVDDKCDHGKGKLEGLAIMGNVRTYNPCSGK